MVGTNSAFSFVSYNQNQESDDKLCEEYGMSVLDYTLNKKLVRCTDTNGITWYYEQTDRKMSWLEKEKAVVLQVKMNLPYCREC